MAIEYDTEDFDPNKRGGFDTVEPGRCHLVLQSFAEFASKSGDHEAEFEIVAHEKESEVGKVHKEYFASRGKATFRVRELAIALGIVTVEELVAAKEQGRAVSLDFSAATGRQMFGTIIKEEYNGKDYYKLNTNLFELTSDRAKSHPFALGLLNRSGIPLDQIPAFVNRDAKKETKAPPQQKQQAATAPPSPPADNSDLF